jgi:hypothetical protein
MLYNANYNLILCGNQNILLIFANMSVKEPNWLLPDGSQKHMSAKWKPIDLYKELTKKERNFHSRFVVVLEDELGLNGLQCRSLKCKTCHKKLSPVNPAQSMKTHVCKVDNASGSVDEEDISEVEDHVTLKRSQALVGEAAKCHHIDATFFRCHPPD